MDEVDLIFCDTFFEVHAVDVKRKPIQLVGTMIASRWFWNWIGILWLLKEVEISFFGTTRWWIVVVDMHAEHMEGEKVRAKESKLLPKSIKEVFKRCKTMLTKELP
jgi:hypothetical protein